MYVVFFLLNVVFYLFIMCGLFVVICVVFFVMLRLQRSRHVLTTECVMQFSHDFVSVVAVFT